MTKPILHVFLISHYCEKARWALDYCGIDYELKLLSPVTHSMIAKKIGAKSTGLPILQTTGGVIEGSADIVAWANQNGSKPILINEASNALEKRGDDVLGIHIRRWYYSEALVECPQMVKPVFSKGASLKDKVIISLAWPKIVKTMIKRMDLGAQQELDSKAIVLKEFDVLDSLISNSASIEDSGCLVDQQFSNGDIALASLIAPMFGPEKHPANSVFSLPPRVVAMSAELNDRPLSRWVKQGYKQYR
jgi:glutathione S-transferase